MFQNPYDDWAKHKFYTYMIYTYSEVFMKLGNIHGPPELLVL